MHGLDADLARSTGDLQLVGSTVPRQRRAAGIFDFAAANDEGENVGGAFRGAFGGDD